MLAISNATAKLNEIEPEANLRYVLEYIAEHPINRKLTIVAPGSLITRRLP